VITEGVGEYSSRIQCTWLIRPTSTAVEYIRLEFDEIDLEDQYDFVTVYDGDSVNARVLGKFSGTSIPGAVTSTGRVIFVAFTTDQSGSGAGFAARWRSYGKNIQIWLSTVAPTGNALVSEPVLGIDAPMEATTLAAM